MADDDTKPTVTVEASGESLDDVRRAAREEHRAACGLVASREPTGFIWAAGGEGA